MSLRRVDDDASASSIDAAIGALADRLPVATRLSHVLTIGAKFKLEQQGKQQPQPQPQPQQPRKSVFTDAYPRWNVWYSGAGSMYEKCRTNPRPGYPLRLRLDAYKNAMIAFGNNPINPQVQQAAINATRDLVASVVSGSDIDRIKKIDFLREEDCYVALNYIVNSNGATTTAYNAARF